MESVEAREEASPLPDALFSMNVGPWRGVGHLALHAPSGHNHGVPMSTG